jgi:hypothetical protein
MRQAVAAGHDDIDLDVADEAAQEDVDLGVLVVEGDTVVGCSYRVCGDQEDNCAAALVAEDHPVVLVLVHLG